MVFSNEKGYKIFINSRTDIFLKYNHHTIETCDDALKRAYEYKKAGADSIFIPELTDKKLITYFVQKSPLTVNIMISEPNYNIKELIKTGVKRISYGPLSYFNSEIDFNKRLESNLIDIR